MAHVLCVDLIEHAVSITAGNPVIRRPLPLPRAGDALDGLARDELCLACQRPRGNASQAAEVCDEIPVLAGGSLEWRHVRLLFARDLAVIVFRKKVDAAVKGLQLQ